ncbi:phage terminase small subunit P27 family [Desulfobacterota bacterium AH_259_B03_O07]|nr:phage terminase small subunit P27 family [Desulfobacterota bacterium AH_259_B03_O07]
MGGKKGRSGRKRKPTNLHIVQGTYRKDRATVNEPKPDLEIPKYITGLSKEAKKHWDVVGHELNLMRVLTRADKFLLRLICDAMVDYDEGMKNLKKQPKIIAGTNKHGSPILITDPNVALVRDAWNRILIGLREFGLTPSSRTKISVMPEIDEDNPWAHL